MNTNFFDFYNNIERADFRNPQTLQNYSNIAYYLVNNRLGNLTWEEGSFLIQFFARKKIAELNLPNNTVIKVLKKEEFAKEADARAKGVTEVLKKKVVFSEEIINELNSSDNVKVLRALRTIFHEVKHLEQFWGTFQTLDRI